MNNNIFEQIYNNCNNLHLKEIGIITFENIISQKINLAIDSFKNSLDIIAFLKKFGQNYGERISKLSNTNPLQPLNLNTNLKSLYLDRLCP